MNTGKIIAGVCLLASLLTGCMRGVAFSYSTYPPSAKHDSKPPYTVWVLISTGLGKSYVERAPKTIRIELYKAGALKTVNEFTTTAGFVDEEKSWRTAGEPTIKFYDYPDGVHPGEKGSKALRREILSKHFRFNPAHDGFDELK